MEPAVKYHGAAVCLWVCLLAATMTHAAADVANPAVEFDSIDTNDDGRVSSSEFEVYTRKIFDEMDVDADDELTNREIMASEAKFNRYVFTAGALLGPAKKLTTAERIERLDVNRDGLVSQGEYANAAAAKFHAMDRNSDGELRLLEFDPGW